MGIVAIVGRPQSRVMIGVIGGTGNVGGALVRMLAEAGEEVVAVSRRGGSDAERVRHVKADLAEPASLAVLAGARAIFVSVGGAGEGLDAGAIIAALGSARLVLLSSIATASRPEAVSHGLLRSLEAEVRERGGTILRPGGFASNAYGWIPTVKAQRLVIAPFADSALPVVDPEDLAAVACAALRDTRHDGATYELTGPSPITPRQQAEVLARALALPISFHEVTRAEAAGALGAFMPRALVETTLDILGTPNAQEQRVSPDIERVLGRPAAPFAAWAQRNVAAFR